MTSAYLSGEVLRQRRRPGRSINGAVSDDMGDSFGGGSNLAFDVDSGICDASRIVLDEVYKVTNHRRRENRVFTWSKNKRAQHVSLFEQLLETKTIKLVWGFVHEAQSACTSTKGHDNSCFPPSFHVTLALATHVWKLVTCLSDLRHRA